VLLYVIYSCILHVTAEAVYTQVSRVGIGLGPIVALFLLGLSPIVAWIVAWIVASPQLCDMKVKTL